MRSFLCLFHILAYHLVERATLANPTARPTVAAYSHIALARAQTPHMPVLPTQRRLSGGSLYARQVRHKPCPLQHVHVLLQPFDGLFEAIPVAGETVVQEVGLAEPPPPQFRRKISLSTSIFIEGFFGKFAL